MLSYLKIYKKALQKPNTNKNKNILSKSTLQYFHKELSILFKDGASSNNRLDIWEEMRTAALLHKGVGRDPTCVPALDVLRMATYEGARAFGFTRKGMIREGWVADLVLVDLDRPHYIGADEENLA